MDLANYNKKKLDPGSTTEKRQRGEIVWKNLPETYMYLLLYPLLGNNKLFKRIVCNIPVIFQYVLKLCSIYVTGVCNPHPEHIIIQLQLCSNLS